MTEQKGKGSETARQANPEAARAGRSNPRTSAAQSELGNKGGRKTGH